MRLNSRAKKFKQYIVDTVMILQQEIVKNMEEGNIERAQIKTVLILKYKRRLKIIKLLTI